MFSQRFLVQISKKQLKASKAYISCQKGLYKQKINNKQKAVKSLQQNVIEIKNGLNCKMSYIHYAQLCSTFWFLIAKTFIMLKNISNVKKPQEKKLCNLVLKNMGNNSNKWQYLDTVIFNLQAITQEHLPTILRPTTETPNKQGLYNKGLFFSVKKFYTLIFYTFCGKF